MEHMIWVDLLYRLLWNIRANLHDVKIAIVSSNEEQLVSLFFHSSAASHIAIPNVRRLKVTSGDCIQRYKLYYDVTPEPDGYCLPSSLVVANEDGKRNILGQFVTQVYAYPNEHIADIEKAHRLQSMFTADDTICFRRV
jgi:hypothetical protein